MSLFFATSEVFAQLRSFVVTVDDKAYVQPVAILDGATLGQHVRHALEFYLCLLEALKSPDPVLNYEARRRDPILETRKEEALRTIDHIEKDLSNYDTDRPLSLLSGTDPTLGGETSLSSSLYREYAYNIEHTIHHMALLRVGAKEVCPDLLLSECFGVAKGTLSYRKHQLIS